ncbi:tetratricopeptide repeat protein [Chloroflexi bacterium TSY]|nr:tetratricopeptide repeat protein [Chloroflexi bacterium TSY]
MQQPLQNMAEVAYVEDGNIWLLNLQTAHRQQLTETGNSFWPTWSPDGRSLLYTNCPSGNCHIEGGYELYILEIDEDPPKRLATDACCGTWNPSNQSIYYIAFDSIVSEPKTSIHSVTPSGSEKEILLSSLQHGEYNIPVGPLRWTQEDPSRLLLTLANERVRELPIEDVKTDIYVIDLVTHRIESLKHNWHGWPEDCSSAYPDARTNALGISSIIFEFRGNGCRNSLTFQQGIHIIDENGSRVHTGSRYPAWSPDGRYLMVVTYHDLGDGGITVWGLALYDIKTQILWQILQNAFQPAWRPSLPDKITDQSADETIGIRDLQTLFGYYRNLLRTGAPPDSDIITTFWVKSLFELASLAEDGRPTFPQEMLSRGALLNVSTFDLQRMNRSDYLRAIETILTEAKQANPTYFDHPLNLARHYRHWATFVGDGADDYQVMLDNSLEAYKEALSVTPNRGPIWNEIGNLYLHRGESQQAQESYQESLTVDPLNSQTYLLLGDFYANREKYAQALEILEEGILLLDNSPDHLVPYELYLHLGFVAAKNNDLQTAIKANLKVLDLQPRNSGATRNLAILYRDFGDLDAALLWAEEALANTDTQDITIIEQLEAFVNEVELQQAEEAMADREAIPQPQSESEIVENQNASEPSLQKPSQRLQPLQTLIGEWIDRQDPLGLFLLIWFLVGGP